MGKKETRTLDLLQDAWRYHAARARLSEESKKLADVLHPDTAFFGKESISKREMLEGCERVTEGTERVGLALEQMRESHEQWMKWTSSDRRAAMVRVLRVHLCTKRLPKYANGGSFDIRLVRYGPPTAHTNVVQVFARRKKWSSSVGTHVIRASAEWLPLGCPEDTTNWFALSLEEGLPLLGFQRIPDFPQGDDKVVRACWIAHELGNRIKSVTGWMACGPEGTVYHSTVSAAHALKGLARKRSVSTPGLASDPAVAESSLLTASHISRGMIRKATGWCTPGIESWIGEWLGGTKARRVRREDVIQAARKCAAQADRAYEAAYGRRLLLLLGACEDEQKTA